MEDNKFIDQLIVCVECGKEFTFSAGEQAYFHSKKLSTPKRCPECRRLRKVSLVPEKAVQDD